ncbi:MAG: hypothetical protein NVS4B4_17380 [Bradyrhizobium sp.]
MPIAAVPLITSLIGAGGAVAGGLMGRKGANTSTQQQTPTYTPDQLAVQGKTSGVLQDRLANGVNLGPERSQGTEQINNSFSGLGDRLTESFARRGFASGSGQLGSGLKGLNLARQGQLGALEGRLQTKQIDEQDKTLSLADQFGFGNSGEKGTSTGPSQGALGGALTGGLQTASLLYALNHMMSSGSSGGSMGGGGFNAGTLDD